MTESMKVPDEFAALIAALQVELYERTGKLMGKAATIKIFAEVATIDQKKLAVKLETICPKKKAHLNLSRV